MARDGRNSKTPDRADAPRPDERPEPEFGPLRGGPMSHWMVEERRS